MTTCDVPDIKPVDTNIYSTQSSGITIADSLNSESSNQIIIEEIPKSEIERLEKIYQQNVLDVICTEECKVAMEYLKHFSSNLIRNRYELDISGLVDNDNCIRFFKSYIEFIVENSDEVMELTSHRKYLNFLKFAMSLWNMSDKFDSLCVRMVSFDVHTLLIRLLGKMNITSKDNLKTKVIILLVMCVIGILHNIINKLQYTRSKYRSENFVHILMPLAALETSEDTLGLKTAALMVLGFLVNENENSILNAKDDHIVYILDILNQSINSPTFYSTYYGYHSLEVLNGLKHIAAPDSNKRILINNGVLTAISFLLKMENEKDYPAEIVAALELLWSLSFVRECNLALQYDGCDLKERVDNLTQSSNPSITLAARGILWNLNNVHRSMSLNSLIRNDWKSPNTNGHIMVSYQHSTQEILVKVKDSLIKYGYKVWMDVDHMRGSFVDAMAEGIQHASVLLLGMCQAFKNSPHCRQEVKYAYTLGIPLVPIMLEPGFVPDGWLGLMCATLIYTEFIDNSKFDFNMMQLQRQLGKLGKAVKTSYGTCESLDMSYLPSSKNCDLQCCYEGDINNLQPSVNNEILVSVRSDHSSALSFFPKTPRHLSSEPSLDDFQVISCSSKSQKCILCEENESEIIPLISFDNNSAILNGTDEKESKYQVENWTRDECNRWFERNYIELNSSSRLPLYQLDGPLLLELAEMRKCAPEAFFKALREDLLLPFADVLRLSRALRQFD